MDISKILAATAALAMLSGAPSLAQQAGCVNNTPCTQPNTFIASGAASLSVTAVSGRVAFPSTGAPILFVTNTGTGTAYILAGSVTAVATTANTVLSPGQSVTLAQGSNGYLAAITASGTTTLTLQSGTGVPTIVYGTLTTPGGTQTTIPAPIAYDAATTGTVTASATIVATPGAKATVICNVTAAGGGTGWLQMKGTTAVVNVGIPVFAGGDCKIFGPLTNPITLVSSSGTVSYTVTLGQ